MGSKRYCYEFEQRLYITLRYDRPLTLPKPDLDFAYFEREGLPTYVLKVSLKMALEVYSDQGSAQCGLVPA